MKYDPSPELDSSLTASLIEGVINWVIVVHAVVAGVLAVFAGLLWICK